MSMALAIVAAVVDALVRKENLMKAKIVRAIAAALITGTLLLAGTAAYGPPGTNTVVIDASY